MSMLFRQLCFFVALLVAVLVAGLLLSSYGVKLLMPRSLHYESISGSLWTGVTLKKPKYYQPGISVTADKLTVQFDWYGTLRYGLHSELIPLYPNQLTVSNLRYATDAVRSQWETIELSAYRENSQLVLESMLIRGPTGTFTAQGEIDWLKRGQLMLNWHQFAFSTIASDRHYTNGKAVLSMDCEQSCTWHLSAPRVTGIYQGLPLTAELVAAWDMKLPKKLSFHSQIGENHANIDADFNNLPRLVWDIKLENFYLPDHHTVFNATSTGTLTSTSPTNSHLAFTLDNKANQTKLIFSTDEMRRENDSWHFKGHGSMGKGKFTSQGDLDFTTKQPSYTVTLKGDQLLLSNTPYTKIIVSPDLKFQQESSGPPLIAGNLFIDNSRIRLKDSTRHVKESDDVVIISDDLPIAAPKPTKTSRKKSKKPLINLSIELGNNNHFDGLGVRSHFNGDMIIKQSKQQPKLQTTGRIAFSKGTYNGYARQLNLVDSYLIFGGDANNPVLHIKGERVFNNVRSLDGQNLTVGVLITESPKHPKLSFYSTPVLPETDVLSYLLFGKATTEANQAQAEMLFDAVNQLSGWFDSGSAAHSIADTLHLDEVSVSSKKGESASTTDDESPLGQVSILLGKQLTNQLYVNYSVGLGDALSSVQLNYMLGRRFELQAGSDGERTGADIVWHHEN